MTYLDTWRSAVPQHLEMFKALLPQTRTIDKKHGLLASALLWHVKDSYAQDEVQDTLRDICGADLKPLLRTLEAWDTTLPLQAADWLQKRAVERSELQVALDKLLLFFMDNIIAAQFIKVERPPVALNVDISGTVQAGIISVGGEQYFWGDVVVNVSYIQQNMLTCPPLPNNPTEFGGRTKELERLAEKLATGKTMAITAALHGLGGIGKTTLAKKLAHHLCGQGSFRTVVWTEVNPNPNPRALLTAWARYGESQFQDDPSLPLGSLVNAAKQRLTSAIDVCPTCDTPRVLVILDDIWEDGVETVRLLDQAKPDGATLLITTRFEQVANTLNIVGEKLGYLTGSDELVDFLYEYLPRELDRTLLETFGQSLGGYPLALKIACARAKDAKHYGSLAAALDQQGRQYKATLQTGSAFAQLELERGSAQEDNFTKSLALSYSELSSEIQQHWRALGVLAPNEPFGAALLQAIWQTDDSQTTQTINTLLLRSLLEPVMSADEVEGETLVVGIYRQHPLLRAYARALLTEAGGWVDAFGRYADYMIEVAAKFLILPPEEWDAALPPHYPHILYVGDELVTQTQTGIIGDLQRAQAFAYNITRYLFNRREVQRLAWLEMGLQTAIALQSNVDLENFRHYQVRKMMFLSEIGITWQELSEPHKALSYFEEALILSQTIGNPDYEGTILHNLGEIYTSVGKLQHALDYFIQALSISRKLNNKDSMATTYDNLGSVWSDLGDLGKALYFYRRALHLFHLVNNKRGEATTLNNIASVWSNLGEKHKALKVYKQALFFYQMVGDKRGEATVSNNIGEIFAKLGKFENALKYFKRAISLFSSIGNKLSQATTLNNVGFVHFRLGELEKVVTIQQEIIDIVHTIGAVTYEALFLYNISLTYKQRGEFDKAIQSAVQGRGILIQDNLQQSIGGIVGATIEEFDAIITELQSK